MKSSLYFLAATLLLAATSCNDESFIEGVGPATNSSSSGANTNTGRITLYCTSANLPRCGSLQVKVNSELKGSITARATRDPGCGAGGTNAVTLTLPAGSYRFSLEYSSLDCMMSGVRGYDFTYRIEKGVCTSYQLQ